MSRHHQQLQQFTFIIGCVIISRPKQHREMLQTKDKSISLSVCDVGGRQTEKDEIR